MSRTVLRAATGLLTAAVLVAVPVTDALAGGKSAKPSKSGKTTTTTTTTTTPTTTTSPAYPTVGSLSAHLRLTVATTSDWTQVAFTPGSVAAQHVTSLVGTATPTAMADGFKLTGVTGATTAVVDLVFYDASAASSYTVKVTKGSLGSTTVDVDNLNAATPVAVVRNLVDTVTGVVGNPVSTTVSHSKLYTAEPMPQPRGDSRALTLAFYYPWFASYDDPTLADQPQDPRTSWSLAGVTSMTAQAKANGVDGFVVSYAGDTKDGSGFDIAKRAAESQGQYVTGYIEVPRAKSSTSGTNADPTVVRAWLVQLLARQSSPAFLKAEDGVPVVFVYGMGYLQPWHWGAIQNSLRNDYGLSVHLVGDISTPAYLPYEWGVHRYDILDSISSLTSYSRNTSLAARAAAVADPTVAPKVYVGTASPGFDDSKLRGTLHPVVSRDGSRYVDTWAAARAGQPDWVVVTSWNEWFEDSQIEPGTATGSRALAETATESAAFRSAPR